MSMHPPTISGATVTLRPPDDQVEQYVANVDDRMAAANRWYQTQVLPRIQVREAQQRQAAADQQRRVREAQERLKPSE